MRVSNHNIHSSTYSGYPDWKLAGGEQAAGGSQSTATGAPTVRHKRLGRTKTRQIAEYYPFNTKRDMNAARRDAERAVGHAVRAGTLKAQPCEVCGARKAEGHHDDYAQPLEVRWLCRPHHRQRDAELVQARRHLVAEQQAHALPLAYLKQQARLQPVPYGTVGTTQPRKRRSLVQHDATLTLVKQVTTAVFEAMAAENVPESTLARRMGRSRQLVNQNFSGGFRSLKVAAAYADALGYEFTFTLRKKSSL